MFRVRMAGPSVELLIELGHAETYVGSRRGPGVQVEALAPQHFNLRKRVNGVEMVLTAETLPVEGGTVIAANTRHFGLGESITLGPFKLTVETERLPEGEERGLLEKSQTDAVARLVYADWLEETGRGRQADYLRAEIAAHDVDPSGSGLKKSPGAELRKLRELRDGAGRAFREWVARRTIENCAVDWEFKCPRQWSELTLTAQPEVRSCAACQKEVTFCHSVEEARTLASAGQCVAIDSPRQRQAGDLTMQRMMGRVATPRQDAPVVTPPAAVGQPPAATPRSSVVSPTMVLSISGAQVFTMSEGEAVAGRAQSCELVIDAPTVSRRHARFIREGNSFFVEDLGTASGTLLSRTQQKIAAITRLENGDELVLGTLTIRVALSGIQPTATPGDPQTAWGKLKSWMRP